MRRWGLTNRVGIVLPATLAGLFFLAACAEIDQGAELIPAEERQALPTQEFQQVEMLHSLHGDVRFRLTAPFLDRYDNQDRAVLRGGIEAHFFEEGVERSMLTAERAEVLRGGRELFAMGNVVVTTDTGATIYTPRLTWSRDNRMIVSDTTVTIVTDKDTLHGTGLEATEDLSRRTILRPRGVSFRSVREDGQEGSAGLPLPGSGRNRTSPADSSLQPLDSTRTESTAVMDSSEVNDSTAVPDADSLARTKVEGADSAGLAGGQP